LRRGRRCASWAKEAETVRGQIHIGTSGWHYAHWRGPFYPEKIKAADMLHFYTGRFDTVEINNSFYRLPPIGALEKWRDLTPPEFCFAVKGSRYLTHMKKLKDPKPGLAKFFSRIDHLQKKLGPILFQLPPGWKCNAQRLDSFLAALPRKHRYAFELRDGTWHNTPVYELLRRYNAAFCIYELAGFEAAAEITADFTYVRLHGPLATAYQGSYQTRVLSSWARRIARWRGRLRDIYVYFDNDQEGFAALNAAELKKMLR
jgi:uncharacterized protein YecE (DUF72 family)